MSIIFTSRWPLLSRNDAIDFLRHVKHRYPETYSQERDGNVPYSPGCCVAPPWYYCNTFYYFYYYFMICVTVKVWRSEPGLLARHRFVRSDVKGVGEIIFTEVMHWKCHANRWVTFFAYTEKTIAIKCTFKFVNIYIYGRSLTANN